MADSQARDRYLQALVSRVAEDQYPSVTQMERIEAMLGPEQLEDYVGMLIERIEQDQYPSIPMMQRVERLLTQLG